MTEPRTPEPFETRLAQLVGAYTDAAAARPVDALDLSRAAMSAAPAARRSGTRLGGGLGRLGDRWAAVAVAAVLVAVVAVAIQGRSSDIGIVPPSTTGPSAPNGSAPPAGGRLPDILRHAWQRPYPVAGPDLYGSGSLTLAADTLRVHRDVPDSTSESTVAAAGTDAFVVTATDETAGCLAGDGGTYRWLLEGSGTYLTLTAIEADSCIARESLLTGAWVRADLPVNQGGVTTLAPGTYSLSTFDPFLDGGRSGRLSYTVPAGWEALPEDSAAFVLDQHSDPAQGLPSRDLLIGVIAQPTMAADLPDGSDCAAPADAPDATGVGRGRDELVAAIRARPGVVSTEPKPVTVAGYPGLSLDLRLAPSWTGWCADQGGGRLTAIPILHQPGAHALVALSSEAPALRLTLLDLGNGKTLAIVIARIAASGSDSFEEGAADAMRIVDSFKIGPSSTPAPSPTP